MPRATRAPKTPPPLTPTRLADELLRYLNQRDASRSRAVTHLQRWITRHYGAERVAAERPHIDALLQRFMASGVLDDGRLARHLVESFRRRGASQRAIAQKLRARGLDSATIEGAFESEASERSERAPRPRELANTSVGAAVAPEAPAYSNRRAARSSGSAELEAAREFVRKRRIGPHRPEPERAPNRRKDLAKLARAGFDFDTACSALGGHFSEDDF
ncbi:MAG TPA: RecX family transcriptional regulator [Polyangiaceae bacterium]|nr:RecX family transcriptional regulator [Polyangiaceae bacterium]